MSTLFLAALLAGLGPLARQVAAETAGRDPRAAATCIDAGAAVMVSVVAPGERALRVHRRRPRSAPGHADWDEEVTVRDGQRHRYHRLVLTPQATDAAAQIRHRVEAAGPATARTFQRVHAALGPRARLYSVRTVLVAGQDVDPDAGPPAGPHGDSDTDPGQGPWVGWQLDRGPVEPLMSADPVVAPAWAAARQPLSDLLGCDPATVHGPWSVSVGLGSTDLVRIGTSRWAFAPDDDGKRDRLCRALGNGGDATFASAMLQLLTQRAAPRERIGRAVEIEVEGGVMTRLETFMAVPSDGPTSVRDHREEYTR